MKHIKSFSEINENIISNIFNKKLINQVKNCSTPDEFYELVKEIYPKTKGAKDGYEFQIINDNLDNLEKVKSSFIGHLKSDNISNIIIYGPTNKKPGRGWFFSTSYMMLH